LIFPFYSFIACKLEAHLGRGKGDLRTSHDFEDIVYVINNNTRAMELLQQAPPEIRDYLKEQFAKLRDLSSFEEAIQRIFLQTKALDKTE